MQEKNRKKVYILCTVGAVLLVTALVALAIWMHGRVPAAKQAEATTGAVQTLPETTTAETTTEPPAPTLTITEPKKETLTVQSPHITIKGACDASLPLTVNGQAVTLAQDGTFSYDCPLKVGKNTMNAS